MCYFDYLARDYLTPIPQLIMIRDLFVLTNARLILQAKQVLQASGVRARLRHIL